MALTPRNNGLSLFSANPFKNTEFSLQPIGSIYVAILDYKPLSTDEDGLPLKEGEQVKVLDTSKPRKWKVVKLDSGESGWVGSYCLEKAAGAVTTQEPATPTQEKAVEIPHSKKE